jgi:hypothetical protein
MQRGLQRQASLAHAARSDQRQQPTFGQARQHRGYRSLLTDEAADRAG